MALRMDKVCDISGTLQENFYIPDEIKTQGIIEEIERRKIRYYVHFTNVSNLESILKNGLMPISVMKNRNITYFANDKERKDGRMDSSCLSITFPNYRMLYKYKNNPPYDKFAVILFDAKEVSKMDCGYFRTNAARTSYRKDKWELFNNINAFRRLFDGERSDVEDNMTTDPQAEVMVKGIIPPSCIIKVCFDSSEELKKFNRAYPQITMSVNNNYFKKRKDWRRWTKDGNTSSV